MGLTHRLNEYSHEYLREPLMHRYVHCKYCHERSQFTCIKCGVCWSCHWKREEEEKKQLKKVPVIMLMEV